MTKSVSTKSAFVVTALVEDVATQFRLRNGGSGSAGSTAYIQATRALAGWARGQGQSPLVHALVHLGWTSTSGARDTVAASSSKAWGHAAEVLTVGENAAEAVVRVLEALTEAGAPAEHIATVWTTFTA
jgi:hypothetical protein